MTPAVIEARDLRVGFPDGHGGLLEAVRGIGLSVAVGEAVGLVGESGSGKSLTALSLMGLVAAPGRISGGSIRFDGRPVGPRDIAALRGREMAMVFQDPQSALNPAVSIGRHLTDVVRTHRGLRGEAARAAAIDALQRVGITDAAGRLDAYPHQFSGGMRQRVLIAMAIACRPRLLIADEPTTALDVTVQAQIVDLLAELRESLDLAVLFISHNLDLVAEIVDRVVVMYGGRVVEDGPVDRVFLAPVHPYTRLLQACVPRLEAEPGATLASIPGSPPRLSDMPPGCPFAPRCPRVLARCAIEMPPLEPVASGGHAACWNPA